MNQEIESLLPESLRPAGTTVNRVNQGQSGAGVYRIEGPAGHFILKRTSADEPLANWTRHLGFQRAAAERGVAPRVVHADAGARVVISEAVREVPFAARYHTPETHDDTMRLLGQTIRAMHDIPLAEDTPVASAMAFMRDMQIAAQSHGPLPVWVEENIQTLLSEAAPTSELANVASHNDLNPSNLIFDGTRLMLLDWNTVSANHPYYDLATVSVFLRMDASACRRLLAAYFDSTPEQFAELPARFLYARRTAAGLAGIALLHVAGLRGYRGASEVTLADAPTLVDVYTAMRTGTLSMSTGEGQWRLGMALHRDARPDAVPAA